MPRLGDSAGGDNSGAGGPPGSRSGATATAYPNLRRNKVATFLYILTMTLILRNMFFNNYKNDAVGYLRSTGTINDEQAGQMLSSKKSTQSRKSIAMEYEQLKKDVTQLKLTVAQLESKLTQDKETSLIETNPNE